MGYLLSIRAAEDLDGPPIFMTSDERVVAAAVAALLAALGRRDPTVLRLARELDEPDRGTP
jgi:hypothetical protein